MITLYVGSEHGWDAEVGKIIPTYNLADVWRAENRLKPLTMQEAREIQRFVSVSPVGKQKIVILEGVEQYRVDVMNTFLKLFEEPPSYLEIVLFAANEHLLPTVKSRIQRLIYLSDFAKIDKENLWQRALLKNKKKSLQRTETLLYLAALTHSQINQEKLLDPYIKD